MCVCVCICIYIYFFVQYFTLTLHIITQKISNDSIIDIIIVHYPKLSYIFSFLIQTQDMIDTQYCA